MEPVIHKSAYYSLAFAICKSACDDFASGVRARVRAGEDPYTCSVGLEWFFRSRWFSLLSDDMDGELVMLKLREQVAQSYKGINRTRSLKTKNPKFNSQVLYEVILEDGTIAYSGTAYDLRYTYGIDERVAANIAEKGKWSRKKINGQRFRVMKLLP